MGKTYRKPETIEATVIGETENNLKLKDITRWLLTRPINYKKGMIRKDNIWFIGLPEDD